MRIASSLQTPNPNALKCVLDRTPPPLDKGAPPHPLRSYASPDAAQHDPLARALFRVEGVRSLLINSPTGLPAASGQHWVSIVKDPSIPWSQLKPKLEAALHALSASTDAPT